MHLSHVAMGVAAVVVGAGSLHASIVDGGPGRLDPLLTGPAIPAGKLGGDQRGLARPHEPAIRVAQASTELPTTGNPSVAPLKWVGVLLNPTSTPTQPNRWDYCTGQFIAPNIVLTAAHCIKDLPGNPTGPWFDLANQTFVLQFQNGEGSQTFKTVCAATNPLWTYPSNYSAMTKQQQEAAQLAAWPHDFALVVVNGNSPTGVMPYMLDWSGKVSKAVRIGYPADILDGAVVQQAPGIVFFPNVLPMGLGTQPNIVAHWGQITNFTQGASGGAWIANFSTTEGPNKNSLIAVSSFTDTRFPGAIFAAYLTAAEFNPLLASAQHGCK